jgi:hypothetical protein
MVRNHQIKIAGPLVPRGGRTRRIAIVGSPRIYRSEELDAEQLANARLIAAAPLLKYAVAEAFDILDGTRNEAALQAAARTLRRALLIAASGTETEGQDRNGLGAEHEGPAPEGETPDA